MSTPRHILLIEDSPTQARYTAAMLQTGGYQVSVAETGQQGIALAQTAALDLILLDVILPDMDGVSVCRHMRQSASSYIPILMFTDQRTAVEDKVVGLAAGADDYMSKTFDPRELLARVTALLRIKQLFDNLQARLAGEATAYQTLKRLALTDQLTGLYNRHYFVEALDREFALALRHATPLGCVMADIDNFRDFNNQYGHPLGDWVLHAAAEVLQTSLRQGDIIARYGGEEFVILLPMTALADARQMAERLRQRVAGEAWASPAGTLSLTLSFGVAALPDPALRQPAHLLAGADQALYQAKNRGRNRVDIRPPSPPLTD